MTKATYELQPTDVFRHPNGKYYQVTSVEHAAGDNYKVYAIDTKNKKVCFIVDVHTTFEIVMTYIYTRLANKIQAGA